MHINVFYFLFNFLLPDIAKPGFQVFSVQVNINLIFQYAKQWLSLFWMTLHCFCMICMVLSHLHCFLWFAWFSHLFMIFQLFSCFLLRNHANPMCNSHHRFFLSTITPTLKFHIWVQAWPGLTCGDLRGPAGTGRDLLGSELILGKISSGSSLLCQLQLPYLFLVLLLQKYEITIPTTKKHIFAWMSWTQHFSTLLATFFEQSLSNTSKQWIAMTNTSVSSTH